MAFLLLLHEKMRLKRQVNKLTLKQTQYGSRLDRMTKNIARVQKMYSSKMTQLEKQAQMAQSQFKSGIMQQLGIGTQGLNPMNFGGMGGTSLFAMNGYNQLAKALSGGITDKDGKETVPGLGDNALAIVQAVVSGNISKNYKEGSTSDVVSGKEWKVGNTTISDAQYQAITSGCYQVRMAESQQSYVASQMSSQYESSVSVWLEAAKAQLEAEQDAALAPLEAEQTDMELDKESVETQLAYARERLQAIEQACSEGIKDSAPKFGLG